MSSASRSADAAINAPAANTERIAQPRRYLMCRPEFFTVSYSINPWMHPDQPTSTAKALTQWQQLYRTYLELGHRVELIDALPGLPDMVYAANGGFTLDGIAYGAKFTYPQRQPEGPTYMTWFREHGFQVAEPQCTQEGEGDILLAGETILAGTGFRSSIESHRELADLFGREVVSLTLVDPRFYHLDTALAVLDPVPAADGSTNIAYLPSAFDAASVGVLRERFPDAILLDEAEAGILGLNSISDGCNVMIASRAQHFAEQLRERSYHPIGIDLSELLLGGGGIKCCTLELRTATP